MKTFLRKLRGILSIGTIWGLVFSGLGAGLNLVLGLIWRDILPVSVFELVVNRAISYGISGFILGSGFAGVIAIMHGRKTFEDLTVWRGALWGALSGLGVSTIFVVASIGTISRLGIPLVNLLPVVIMYNGIKIAVTTGLGAGTVAVAKRAPAELEAGTGLYEELPTTHPNESSTLPSGTA